LSPELNSVRSLVETEIERYVDTTHNHVKQVVNAHFSLRAVLLAHKRHLRFDAWRLVLNFILALPTLVVRRGSSLAEKLGFDGLHHLLEKVPLPLPTAYEREMAEAIERDLFAVGGRQDSAVLKAIEADAAMQEVLRSLGKRVEFLRKDAWIREEVHKCLHRWSALRAQMFGGLSSVAVVLVSYAFFRAPERSPNLSGAALAAWQARDLAASEFFLGRALGNVFYTIAPVHPSFTQIMLATLTTLALIAGLTLFVSLTSDPLQRLIGSQKRQLHRTLDELEELLALSLKRRLRRAENGEVDAAKYDTLDDVLDLAAESGKVVARATAETAQEAVAGGKRAAGRVLAPVAKRLRGEWDVMEKVLGPGLLRFFVVLFYGGMFAASLVMYNRLNTERIENARRLVQAGSYRNALVLLDSLLGMRRFADDAELLALKARSFCGLNEVRGCAEAYERLMSIHPSYSQDEEAITQLIDALARSGHWYPRRVLVEQVGNRIVPRLRALALERRRIERWEIARTLDQLGDSHQPVMQYFEIEMTLARTCKAKIAALEKYAETERPDAIERLRDMLAKPSEKCLHEEIRTTLAKVSR
jgi:hypothetical protein